MTSGVKFTLEHCELIAPVTALEFGQTTKLFVGEGPYLKIYETTCGRLVTKVRVFDNQRIHLIKLYDSDCDAKIVVCGGRIVSALNLQQNSELISEIEAIGSITFNDWIWDVCLLQERSENVSCVAVVTGHNEVWIWDFNEDRKWKVSQCQEQCILYCARFIGKTLDHMWLACGTVFNEVLLWKVTDNKASEKVPVRKRLTGYDGVIFSVRYYLERQLLCSVSDDRSIRVWRTVFHEDFSNVTVSAEPILTLYGHKARVWDCRIVKKYIVSIGEDSMCLLWNLEGQIIRSWKGHIGGSQITMPKPPVFGQVKLEESNRRFNGIMCNGSVRVLDFTPRLGVKDSAKSTFLLANLMSALQKETKYSKSIWSLACDLEENLIATGGGDGAIRVWPVENESEEKKEEKHLFSTIPCQNDATHQTVKEIPRMIGFLHDSSVLVMTDKGNLYNFRWLQDQENASGKWNLIRNEPELSSYSVMALTDCRTIVALGNISGSLKLISLTDLSWLPLERNPYTDKMFNLHWLKSEHDSHFNLFSCGPEGVVTWWIVECLKSTRTFSCEVKANLRLPYCRQRWPNSVFLYGHNAACSELGTSLVFCGDRRGSLHVFKPTTQNEPTDPVQSLIGIHGRNGVTSICCNSGYVYTTGRDGYIRQYKLFGENLELLDRKKVYKGMEWIDRVNFTPEGDVLVLGFHTVDFIIWSMTRNEVLFRISCGGGHRNWDILYTTTNHGTSTIFTYLKQSTVHVHSSLEIKRQCTSIIQDSFHGRETNCLCFIGCLERRNEHQEAQIHLFATGSEDTTINIMIYNPSKINGRRCRKVVSCEGHISSVRCLASIRVNPGTLNETRRQQHLLFSGGSRASLKCWSLDVDSILNSEMSKQYSELDISLNSSCRLLAELRSLSSKSRRKKRFESNANEDFTCDIRFMSLSAFSLTDLLRSVWTDTDVSSAVGVIACCSDGHLRFYVFDYELKTFTLIGQGTWNERCVLCVGHFFHIVSTQLRVLVYASDTAGLIGFWDVTRLYIEYFSQLSKSNTDEDLLEEEYCSLDAEKDDCVLSDKDDSEIDGDLKPVKNFGFQNCGADNLSKFKSNEDVVIPFYSHKLHQSGVNSISLMLKENDKYLLCSGGDDGAVTFSSFEVYGMEDNADISSWRMISVPDAHIAATTGVKLLDSNFAVSASVDQRLKLWKINWSNEKTTASLINSFWLDVVDVHNIDVERDRNGLYCIATSGVGLQMLAIKCV